MGHGTRVVWVIHPAKRIVLVLRPGAVPITLHLGDTADAEPVLPGFRVELKALFDRLPYDAGGEDVYLT